MDMSAWDRLSEAYANTLAISDDYFHLGPNGVPLDLTDARMALGVNTRVLDLGCGAGHNSRAIAKRCGEVVAVDASIEQIVRARRLTHADNIQYCHADVMEFLAKSPSGSYDFVFSVFTLEYVADLDSAFTESQRVLKKGGQMLYCDLHPFASSSDVVAATLGSFSASLNYFKEGARPFTWTLGGTSANLVRHHRTLSTVLGSALRGKLSLMYVSEPQVVNGAEPQPYHDDTIVEQIELWSRIPYTLVLLFGAE